jgi:hypothetical protein
MWTRTTLIAARDHGRERPEAVENLVLGASLDIDKGAVRDWVR